MFFVGGEREGSQKRKEALVNRSDSHTKDENVPSETLILAAFVV